MANYLDTELADAVREQRKTAHASHKKRIGMGTMQGWESAEVLARLDAAATRLEQLARLSPLQQQFLDLVFCIEAGSAAPVKKTTTQLMNITGAQCEKITRLLNHPFMPRPEKTQGLLKINHLNEDEADVYIQKLEQRWAALDNEPQIAGPDVTQVKVIVAEAAHPALARTSRDEAYEELTELLRNEHVRDDERVKAGKVIGEMSEAQLREKLAVVKATIATRASKKQAVAA